MKFSFNLSRFIPFKSFIRPAYFLIILVLIGCMVGKLFLLTEETENYLNFQSTRFHNRSMLEIETTAAQLGRFNTSASGLARSLSLSLDGTELSFNTIETKIAPTLFLALSTIPQILQASYIGVDGLLFSFYNDKDQTFAVYANTSFSPTWYKKPVNHDTGKLYGDAVASESMEIVNTTWFQNALNRTSGYSSLGSAWNKRDEFGLFLNTVAMDGRGVISLGYPTDVIVDSFTALDLHGGIFHLGTADGQVIVQAKLPNTQINTLNSTVFIQKFEPNGELKRSFSFSCATDADDDKNNLSPHYGEVLGTSNAYYCSILDIAGVQSVYVLAYPRDGLTSIVHRNINYSLALLVLLFIIMFISICTYIRLTARATRREMVLCAALIKQTEATQQAERKSMNKTKAYAVANHDVRASLAGITALIDFCKENAKPETELAENLVKMESYTNDLLGILNSILDTSKIESGRATLDIEDFNLAQLLEDVVDMFYRVGMKKEVDVVLDPCDGSVLKLPLVRGDRLKLKQILCNLINNATKFTTEGHVAVRAVVKTTNLEKDIIASNSTPVWKFLLQFCYQNKDGFNDLDALRNAKKENPNEVEVEFEVDDTGKGVPKDKQQSIFEDYVQVKETTIGQQGCGLGLGIVQSLVRVMKGELRIVEKEPGEKGTCFKFNVFLSTCNADSDENRPSTRQHFPFMSPKLEGSHVVMLTTGEERTRVLKKYMESMNIKVTVIKHLRNFRAELEKIKSRLDLPYIDPGRTEAGYVDHLRRSTSTNSDVGPSINNEGSNIQEGSDHITVLPVRSICRNSSVFVLLMIDTNYSTILTNLLASFRRGMPKHVCKVVWLNDGTRLATRNFPGNDLMIPEGDHLVQKPIHGSRLMQVLSLLPEFKGTSPQCNSLKRVTRSTTFMKTVDLSEDETDSIATSAQCDNLAKATRAKAVSKCVDLSEDSETGCAAPLLHCNNLTEVTVSGEVIINVDTSEDTDTDSFQVSPQHHIVTQVRTATTDLKTNDPSKDIGRGSVTISSSENLPLKGKRILVVDDVDLLRKLMQKQLSRLGADVDICSNGKEALDQVHNALRDLNQEGESKKPPYYCIFMDCEMEVMNGYEATRLIRAEEQQYRVHTPIVALTAHAMPEGASKTADAGMDFHLAKPFKLDKISDLFRSIDSSSH